MKTKMHIMKRLNRLSVVISGKRGERPYSKFVAFRKIFIQEKRDWKKGGIQTGWKRGEIFDVFEALLKLDFEDFKKEWGDIGYYVASSYSILKWLYCVVTPLPVLEYAVNKFYGRAMKK